MTALHISPEELAPRPRHKAKLVSIVPRERVTIKSYAERQAEAKQAAEIIERLAKAAEVEKAKKDRADEEMRRHNARISLLSGPTEVIYIFGRFHSDTPGPIRDLRKAHALRVFVCDQHEVCIEDLVSTDRAQEIVAARHHLMWLLRNETSWSMLRIGRFFGGRDHTTVLHGIRAHERRIAMGGVRE